MTSLSFGQVFITEIADPNGNADARFIELYNAGASAVDFTEGNGWQLDKYTNASGSVSISLDLTGSIPAGGFYIIGYNNSDGAFAATYGFAPNQLDDVNNGVTGSNGDDDIALVDGTDTIVDFFGIPGTDNSGTCAEYEDGRAERLTSVTSGNPTFTESEWNVWADSTVDGCTSHQNAPRTAPGDFDPGAWGTPTCGFSFLNGSAVCDNITAGTDTYTATVDFTGGGTASYTVTSDAGTIDLSAGDPSVDATGTITITGLTEGVNVVINAADGNICDVDYTIFAADCVPSNDLPLYEPFDYTSGENLGDQTNWTNDNSGDEVLIASGSLNYTDLAISTGNSVSFDGGGFDPYIEFTAVSSGTVYASFIFTVTDQSAVTDSDGGYFAVLGDFDARLWVHPNPDPSSGTFEIGVSNGGSNPPFTTSTYNVGDAIFAVMSYDISTGTVNAWINPASGDFGAVSAPTATITDTDASPATSLNQFLIRQDSANETPFITFDELRIGTSWADVTPNTLSTNNFETVDFTMYPNPTSTGKVTITTSNSGNVTANVYDVLGKQVINRTVTNNTLDVSNLNAGLYIVKLTQNGNSVTKKLVIK